MSRPVHTVIVSVVVRDAENRLLLIKHPHRGWELPQGHVEQGEDLCAAASREVLEESGYDVEVVRLIAVFSKLSPDPSSVIFGFAARVVGGEATTSDESLEVGWFDEELAVEMPEHPVNRNRLQKLLGPQQGVGYYSYCMSPFEYAQEYRI
jgi:8-oxo-dGTP diphosphatase